MQGWRAIAWARDVSWGVYYFIDVQGDGSARAVFSERAHHTHLGDASDLGGAMVLCALHAEEHGTCERATAPGWYAITWALYLADGDHRYFVDANPDGTARAALITRAGSTFLGMLPDLGHAFMACSKHQDALTIAGLTAPEPETAEDRQVA